MTHWTQYVRTDYKKCRFGVNQLHFVIVRDVNILDIVCLLSRRIFCCIENMLEHILGTVVEIVLTILEDDLGYPFRVFVDKHAAYGAAVGFFDGNRGFITIADVRTKKQNEQDQPKK